MFFHQQFSGGISGPFIIPHIYFGELRIKVRQLRDANNAIYQKRLVVAARELVLSKLWVKRWISPLELLKLRKIVRPSLVKGTSWGPGLGVRLKDLKLGRIW